MPYLDIKLSGPCRPDHVAALAARMTDLAVDVLHKRRDVTAAAVQCISPAHWTIGGESIATRGETSFSLEINVTAGTNTEEEKKAFVAAAYAAAEALLGKLAAASYVIVREIPANAWGYEGVTQRVRQLQRTAV